MKPLAALLLCSFLIVFNACERHTPEVLATLPGHHAPHEAHEDEGHGAPHGEGGQATPAAPAGATPPSYFPKVE